MSPPAGPVETINHDFKLWAGIVASAMILWKPTRAIVFSIGLWVYKSIIGPGRIDSIDITQKKIFEEILSIKQSLSLRDAQNDFLFFEAINSSRADAFIADKDGNTIKVTDAWCLLTKINRERAISEGWISAVNIRESHNVREEWERCIAERKPFRFRHRFDNNPAQYETIATPTPSGGFFGIVKDAAMVRAEERLEQTEQTNAASD
jgi:PAS domain-containing protein